MQFFSFFSHFLETAHSSPLILYVMTVSKTLLLSEEVLILIMSHVGSLSQLKVCRLVCEAWWNPGLINMLSQEIILQSEIGLFRLFHLLMADPSRGYLIKLIKLNWRRLLAHSQGTALLSFNYQY